VSLGLLEKQFHPYSFASQQPYLSFASLHSLATHFYKSKNVNKKTQ